MKKHTTLTLLIAGTVLIFIPLANILAYSLGQPTHEVIRPTVAWPIMYAQLGFGIIFVVASIAGLLQRPAAVWFRTVAMWLLFGVIAVSYPATLWLAWPLVGDAGPAVLLPFAVGSGLTWLGLIVAVAYLLRKASPRP